MFEGRFECTVRSFRPFPTAFMSNHPHTVHTLMLPGRIKPSMQYDWKQCGKRSFCLYCRVFYAVLNIIYVKSPPLITYSCILGDSTQLLNSTEHTVTKGAIARPAFRGRLVCIVGCFRPFSTSYMSNHAHWSHTHASWAIQPSYSIVLNTLWQREQLPALLLEVV